MQYNPYQNKSHSEACRHIDAESGWGKDDFLGLEPFKQGYLDQLLQQPKNTWSLGSPGYYLYEMGLKEAKGTQNW